MNNWLSLERQKIRQPLPLGRKQKKLLEKTEKENGMTIDLKIYKSLL